MNERDEQKQTRNNIIYAAIGVMTLIVAITGATFAYFTATRSSVNALSGNMATISFNLTVTKVTTVDENKGGLIPMTNSMVQKAVSNASTNGICVDDNDNAVCQVYKIIVENTSTASMFVDGYVTLVGGSGSSTDITDATTTMRWAQVFCTESSGTLSSCTTEGKTTTRATTTVTGGTDGIDNDWDALGSDGASQADTDEILQTFANVKTTGTIQGNDYDIINTNYIRISKHTTGDNYTQSADVTSALVYNQYLEANDNSITNNGQDADGNSTGDSSDAILSTTGTADSYADAQVYYIVVWLSETGTNQTAGSGGTSVPSTTSNFFQGNVRFKSAQGSEVTATFVDYTAVTPDTTS